MSFSRAITGQNLHVSGNLTVESLQLPKHVQPIKWAPQNDILAHPATKAFITHAGANSLYEAAYHAVPVVAIPIFGDQPRNAAQVTNVYNEQSLGMLTARQIAALAPK